VAEWKQPTNVMEIRSFLGLAGYYRRFIEGFSKIARPMTALTQKEKEFPKIKDKVNYSPSTHATRYTQRLYSMTPPNKDWDAS